MQLCNDSLPYLLNQQNHQNLIAKDYKWTRHETESLLTDMFQMQQLMEKEQAVLDR